MIPTVYFILIIHNDVFLNWYSVFAFKEPLLHLNEQACAEVVVYFIYDVGHLSIYSYFSYLIIFFLTYCNSTSLWRIHLPIAKIIHHKKFFYTIHYNSDNIQTKDFYNICTMLDKRRRRWPLWYKCYTNVTCLLEFFIPALRLSMCVKTM